MWVIEVWQHVLLLLECPQLGSRSLSGSLYCTLALRLCTVRGPLPWYVSLLRNHCCLLPAPLLGYLVIVPVRILHSIRTAEPPVPHYPEGFSQCRFPVSSAILVVCWLHEGHSHCWTHLRAFVCTHSTVCQSLRDGMAISRDLRLTLPVWSHCHPSPSKLCWMCWWTCSTLVCWSGVGRVSLVCTSYTAGSVGTRLAASGSSLAVLCPCHLWVFMSFWEI